MALPMPGECYHGLRFIAQYGSDKSRHASHPDSVPHTGGVVKRCSVTLRELLLRLFYFTPTTTAVVDELEEQLARSAPAQATIVPK